MFRPCLAFLFVVLLTAGDIRFSTTEGTWMSVDVAPDGRTIVFDLLGDLYLLPITGGIAKPILTGPAFESQPRFSPDGARLAFTSDRDGALNLWVANADGSQPKQLSKLKGANLFSPAWMPDGKSVLVSVVAPARQGSAELWRFPIDGGPGEKVRGVTGAPPPLLVSAPPHGVFGAVPTSDGSAIYFASVTPRIYNSRSGASSELVRRALNTGAEEVLTARSDVAFKPLLSPDGKLLVYAAHWEEQTRLRVRNLETLRESWIKFPIQRDELEARATRDVLPTYAFTPDSRFVIAAFGGHLHRIDVSNGMDQMIPFRADVHLTVTDRLDFPITLDQGPVRARIAQNPALSPDGKRVAFSALGQLYLASSEGGAPTRVTTAEHAREFQPAWSPDGARLAYVTGRGIMDSEGLALTSVTAFYHDPVWTPDGSGVVAMRAMERDRLEDVVLIRGGQVTRIAAGDGFGRPHFVKDRLCLYSLQQGLVSMRLDGSDRRTLARVPGAMDVEASPDGVHAAARLDQWLYVIDLPADPATPVNAASIGQQVTRGLDTFRWAGANKLTWALGSSFFVREDVVTERQLEVEQPRHSPKGSIVLRGGTVITMRGEEVLRNADVVTKDNRIVAVGPRGKVAVPAGARVIDITGQTVIPGLVDIHAHVSMPRGVPDTSTHEFAANLAYGVTAMREPQSFSNDIFVYGDLAETGELLAPRVFTTGPGVFEQNRFSSYEEVRAVVARYKERYRTHLLKSYLVGDRQVRQWVSQACRELGVMPTTEGGGDLALNLTHAIDGFSGNEHALPTVPLSNDVVQLYARTGITYTPTLIVAFGGPFGIFDYLAKQNPVADAKLKQWFPPAALYSRLTSRLLWFTPKEYVYSQIAAGAAAIQKAGGSVAIGGHGELQGLQTHWEMWMLASGGMSNLEVLRAGTLNGARAIGLGRELGSIEPGKLADLVVLRKDPLADIRNTTSLRFVMRNGELFSADDLAQIAPESRPAPPRVWLRD